MLFKIVPGQEVYRMQHIKKIMIQSGKKYWDLETYMKS